VKSEIRKQKAEIGRVARAFLRSAFCLLLFTCSQRAAREHLEFWALGAEGDQVAPMIREFERANPGIRVTMQQIPWTAAHEKLLTACVGNSVPDVAQMGNTWVPEFVAVHALDELPETIVDRRDYFAGSWDSSVVDGKLYGIPWYVDTRVVFYRTDVLAAAGYAHPPRTWSEWTDAMQRIRDRKLSRFAILLPTNEWEPMAVIAVGNHSTLLNAQGTQGAFRQPPYAQAFDFYVNMFRLGFAPSVSNTQIANVYQQFAQGDFAMYITGPWQVGAFKERLPADVQDKWATTPMPAPNASESIGTSLAGGSTLVLFRDGGHKEAARKLIAFLSEPAQQIRLFDITGDLPARRSAWRAPQLANEPHFPAFREQLEHVVPLPKVPEWEQIATVIEDRDEAAARGTTTTARALADLDRRADELLEKRRWILARK